MHSKSLKGISGLIAILLLLSMPVLAQADDAPLTKQGISSGIEWRSLSTEEQTLLAPFAEKWQGLPPGRQQRLRKGIKRWASLSPEKRARIKKRFARWNQLPPKKRQRVRRQFEHFMSLPPAERKRLRAGFRDFRNLSPERRAALRARWQKMSPAQRRAVVERRQMQRRGRQEMKWNLRRNTKR